MNPLETVWYQHATPQEQEDVQAIPVKIKRLQLDYRRIAERCLMRRKREGISHD